MRPPFPHFPTSSRATQVPLQIYISGANGPEERRLLSLLIEDKTKHEISYVDYLCAVHRRIQQKMQ